MAESLRPPLSQAHFPGARIAGAPAASRSLSIGALPSLPPHVGTMLGLSVAGYGVALALVTGLQASSEAATRANREPVAATLDRVAAGHDRLGREIGDAAASYAGAAERYQSLGDGLAGIEARLSALAASVTAVDGAARALPASVALPPVVRSVRTSTTKSTSHATSGGSAAP